MYIYFTVTGAVKLFEAANFAAAVSCCDRSFRMYRTNKMNMISTLRPSY